MRPFIKKLIACLKHALGMEQQHQKHYFVPGEMVFQVEHPDATINDDSNKLVLQALRTFLTSDANFAKISDGPYKALSENWRNNIIPPEDGTQVITFSATETAKPFSLVPVAIRAGQDVLAMLNDAVLELSAGPVNMEENFSLVSVSPNWVSSGLHHGGGTGGPGSWPKEAPKPTQNEIAFRFGQNSIHKLDVHKNSLAGKVIHVAILDTVPTNTVTARAMDILGQLRPAALAQPNSPEALMQFVFGGNLTIHAIRPGNATFANLAALTPPPFHYPIPDHGTFVAGIIRSITTTANIHLHQVLNEYGIGTLTSVSQGLYEAVNSWAKDKAALIINCSFMFDTNLPAIVDLLRDPVTTQVLTRSMRDVFAWATNRSNVVVVAAAGNDAQVNSRHYARFPAAFKKVLGVGALPKGNPVNAMGRYIPASYSNFAYSAPDNELPEDGFMVFGGELDNPANPKAHYATAGVLGIYLGGFPEENASGNIHIRPSSTGALQNWAHWAGTSFSAPIITGLLAALAGNEPVDTSLVPPNNGPYLTAEGENVIIAQQG